MSIHKTLKSRATAPAAGFTMVELLIIILIIGVFSAIVTPSWLMFINNHRLKLSVDRAYWAMELALSNAKRDKISWQTSFKEVGKNLQVAVHPAEITPAQVPPSQWKNLEPQIQINPDETTLLNVNENNKATGEKTIRRVMFNFRGCVVYNSTDECGQTSLRAKGTLTLSHPDLKNSDRCVIVSTLLGHKRTSQRQRTAKDGRYCY
ncbi:transcriptional regulator [Microcoleus sp. A2-C5]|uniref:transcriptional regulator n=1 Tax=Microcoleus sp. A2-C2 TaxID=2818530 RepID=UPI002FD5AB76|nr:transcriptional regulator [Lyngbya sp. CCAP 1446/10]